MMMMMMMSCWWRRPQEWIYFSSLNTSETLCQNQRNPRLLVCCRNDAVSFDSLSVAWRVDRLTSVISCPHRITLSFPLGHWSDLYWLWKCGVVLKNCCLRGTWRWWYSQLITYWKLAIYPVCTGDLWCIADIGKLVSLLLIPVRTHLASPFMISMVNKNAKIKGPINEGPIIDNIFVSAVSLKTCDWTVTMVKVTSLELHSWNWWTWVLQ